MVWLGSVYQFLFALLGSCCGVHHAPQNSGGMVGGSAPAALAPSAVAAAAAISRLFIVASSGSDGVAILSCGSGIVIARWARRPCRRRTDHSRRQSLREGCHSILARRLEAVRGAAVVTVMAARPRPRAAFRPARRHDENPPDDHAEGAWDCPTC